MRDEVRNGTQLSDAFRAQGIFPKIYVTSVMAGEKSGSLTEVLDRYITYQKLALAVRKKVLVSLMYPSVLLFLAICLIVFLVTYVVPNFATLYASMQAKLPAATLFLIAVGTTARNYILVLFGGLVAVIAGFRLWSRRESARTRIDALQDAGAGVGRDLDEVPGGAVFARAGHAAGRRHPAGAGSGHGGGIAGHAAAVAGLWAKPASWCARGSRCRGRSRPPRFFRRWPST